MSMMHDDQVPIDLGTVRALIHDQFPQWSAEPIVEVPTDGTVNAIFRIGADRAARFPLRAAEPAALAETLRAEAAAMTELSESCPFPTPQPLAIGRPTAAYPMPWSVQSWIPGEVATPSGLAASAVFTTDLAALISSLRAADTRGRRFSGGGRGGTLSDQDDWMRLCFEKSAGFWTFRGFGRSGPGSGNCPARQKRS